MSSIAALNNLVSTADASASRQLVEECVRTAYALGKFDAIVEATLADVNAGRHDFNFRREVLS